MQRFRYQAFSREGTKVTGVVDASDAQEARRVLRGNGLTVQQLVADGVVSSRRFTIELGRSFDTAGFFRELGVLSGSGLTLDQALHVMKSTAGRGNSYDVVEAMAARLAAGEPPSVALQLISDLPQDLRALVSVGERSGSLPFIFSVISEDLSRRASQRKKLVDAAVYPAFLLLMMFGALLMVTFVLVPALQPVFEGSDRDPPLMISLLSGLRELLIAPWFSFVASFSLLAMALTWMIKANLLRELWGNSLRRMPIIGSMLHKTTLARYLQSLALLLENSVSLPEALALSADCCGVAGTQSRMVELRDKVVSGRPLSEAFHESTLFSSRINSLVRAGDQVNKLPIVLSTSSELLREEVQRRADALLALMTPIVTIVMGLLVGGLVISVMTALLSVNELGVS
ncbi:hypothetical protein N185_15800 [Sinorhizobium sp. GW3]|nr:hypothetical protein N185_15800 [Sinorhizobium sp. GW3]